LNFFIKEKHRYEDAEFPTAVLMVQWINGRVAALRDNWRLDTVSTGLHGSDHWVGLVFEEIPVKTA
jgi:hypothetical protein